MRTDPAKNDLLLGKRLALASIATSAVLAFANIVVGLLAHSTSVVAAGVEFLGDVVGSIFVLTGMHLAARPPDENHPYGHGRIEILSGLGVGFVLLAGGIGICYQSLQRVSEIHQPPSDYALFPLIGAIVIRSAMSIIKFRVGRRIGSRSLIADGWNDAVDILSAFAALAALGLTLYDPIQFLAADHYGGFAVGLFVIYTGLRVLRDCSTDLIDTMPDDSFIQSVRRTAAEVPNVRGVEKCYARKIGLKYHVEIHIEVHPAMTVAASHDVASHVRDHLRSVLPAVAQVTVHIEPQK